MHELSVRSTLKVSDRQYEFYRITSLEERKIANLSRLPFSIRILLENLLRKRDNKIVTEADILEVANWKPFYQQPREIAFHPARVVMQDFTGVPAVVDLAAMRDVVRDLGGDVAKVNPLVPVDLVTDHSVQVDVFGRSDAAIRNLEFEYARNRERYKLLKWAQKVFKNLRIFPPGAGIVHQVNLEFIAHVVMAMPENGNGSLVAYPDTLVGTDSHTTMINGIGVVGWGVGGIEAEAVMLGQPYFMKIPEVIGVRLKGNLQEGITATDLVLTITELLRKQRVVEKFVEFFGPGVKGMSVPDRATISNMCPEYGATIGYFPIDEATVDFLKFTNRAEQAALVNAYALEQGLFFHGDEQPDYTRIIELDLATVEPSVAGPARPQDRIPLHRLKGKQSYIQSKPLMMESDQSGLLVKESQIDIDGKSAKVKDGSVVIAAITSCTNTSNPTVMVGAGLLARKAVERGLTVPPYVKTSFAPGSKVVLEYLTSSGLMPYLEKLKFHCVGFGCTTCIGNSGPLIPEVEKAIVDHKLNVSSVLSGNRNFEARIHPLVRSNYLASPLLVIAFALAGRTDIDISRDPLGEDSNGEPVYLQEIWPTDHEIRHVVTQSLTASMFARQYAAVLDGDENWNQLQVNDKPTFDWDKESTYIRKPPFFDDFSLQAIQVNDILKARIYLMLGDSITTDHISPAGSIPAAYPAGQYLRSFGIAQSEFNSYGSRRGNHEVMMRGTFANVRIKNKLVEPREGGFTVIFPESKIAFNYDAAMEYLGKKIPIIVLGGKEYGSGSSRDWAAKGPKLLGVRAILAESFERIHRNNLIGMGILPLVFLDGETWNSHGLTGQEEITIEGLIDLKPGMQLTVKAVNPEGNSKEIVVQSRLDTAVDIEYFVNGGIMPLMIRKLMGVF
jgi:aconitate hydratase